MRVIPGLLQTEEYARAVISRQAAASRLAPSPFGPPACTGSGFTRDRTGPAGSGEGLAARRP